MNQPGRGKGRPRSRRNGRDNKHLSTEKFIHLGGRRYEVLEQLSLPDRGRWLVRDFRPHPRGTLYVAIVLPDNEATAQLRRSLLRLPMHANSLPSLVDHGSVNDRYCLIIDWWKGMDFATYLKRVRDPNTPRPSPTECVRLFRGVAHSMRILHDVAQIVHGDLKPANLVLTTSTSSLRLIDFGSSWQLERSRSRLPGDGSDPTFRAPELYVPDSPIDPASDQFSLGVILYLALTLKIPYEGLGGKVGHPDFRDEFQNSGSALVAPSTLIEFPDRLPESITGELDRLVRRLLQIDPRKRFPNSRAMTDAFDRLSSLIQSKRFEEPRQISPLSHLKTIFSQIKQRFKGRSKG